jgi:hypothetical protein
MYALDAGGVTRKTPLIQGFYFKNIEVGKCKAIKMLLKFVMTSTPKVIKFIIPILAWGVRSLPEDSNSGSSGGSELSAKQRHR